MSDASDLLTMNLAWIGWELVKAQGFVDWTLGAVGSVVLIAINCVKLWRLLNSRAIVDNDRESINKGKN